MYILYILRCANNALYTGITNNLENRLEMHESGKGSKYVRANSPFQLVYTEEFADKSSALKRELAIKRLTKSEKEQIIRLRKLLKGP